MRVQWREIRFDPNELTVLGFYVGLIKLREIDSILHIGGDAVAYLASVEELFGNAAPLLHQSIGSMPAPNLRLGIHTLKVTIQDDGQSFEANLMTVGNNAAGLYLVVRYQPCKEVFVHLGFVCWDGVWHPSRRRGDGTAAGVVVVDANHELQEADTREVLRLSGLA